MAIDRRIPEVREISHMTSDDLNHFWQKHETQQLSAPSSDYFSQLEDENSTKVVLPRLNSNNSIESSCNVQSSQHKKSATALELNVYAFIKKFGLNNTGFLTLTFPDKVYDFKEASRRFNSLRTNFLNQHFRHYIRVYERHNSGAIHIHLIVNTKLDIRTNFSFQQVAARNYSSASFYLRSLWSELRAHLPRYGFGRAELMPIKSNGKGLSKYVSKYIGKHIANRKEYDKGCRLVQFSSGAWKVATSNFSFFTDGSAQWRSKLQCWALNMQEYFNQKYNGYFPVINQDNYSEVFCKYLGSSWAFVNRDEILNVY